MQSRLKKELDFLTPKRATGELHKLKNKLSLLNESVKKKSIYEEGLEENKKTARRGGSIAGNTRKEIEKETGKPVINSKNAIDFSRLIDGVVKDKTTN